MPTIETINSAVPHFETVDGLRDALGAKSNYEPVDLYPRDGTELLTEVEARVAGLVGVEEDELILCTSGMAAIVTAIEACRNKDTVIAAAYQTYSQTGAMLDRIAAQGTRVVRFDSGDLEHIDGVIGRNKPTILLTETVANGPDAPALDLKGLLSMHSLDEAEPTIILDNTLPLATSYPLTEAFASGHRVIGVESGTKSYTFNSELSGLLYTVDRTLLRTIQSTRRTLGTTPGVASVERINDVLPASRVEFDERNKAVFKNTGSLALDCLTAAADQDYGVAHPWLQPQLEERAESPVLFIHCRDDEDQFELTERLWRNPEVREQARLGQSFGFNEARILPAENWPIVRIAGGANTDAVSLGTALQLALTH